MQNRLIGKIARTLAKRTQSGAAHQAAQDKENCRDQFVHLVNSIGSVSMDI
jgi:hypothetical protein